MKKIILFFLLAFASANCFARNDVVTEICGVKFGSNRPTARSILTAKYGDPNMDELNLIEFDNVRYAGISFDFGYFSFQTDGIRSYFNECILGFFAEKQMKRWKKLRDKASDTESINFANQNIDRIMMDAVDELDRLE